MAVCRGRCCVGRWKSERGEERWPFTSGAISVFETPRVPRWFISPFFLPLRKPNLLYVLTKFFTILLSCHSCSTSERSANGHKTSIFTSKRSVGDRTL